MGERYQLGHELPRGGLGLSFVASEASCEEPLLVRLLPRPPELSRERFMWQVRKAVSLAHFENRHVAPIRDFGVFDSGSGAFLVRMYQPGATLREHFAAGAVRPVHEVVSIVAQLATALSEAHSRDIFHGRLKPDNVLVDASGEVRLVDFGCWQLPEGCQRMSLAAADAEEGHVSPSHTLYAPQSLNPASRDMRALGAVLVELLTRRCPGPEVDASNQVEAALGAAKTPPALVGLALSLLNCAPLSLEEARRQMPVAPRGHGSAPVERGVARAVSEPGHAPAGGAAMPVAPRGREPNELARGKLSASWVARLQQLFARSRSGRLE